MSQFNVKTESNSSRSSTTSASGSALTLDSLLNPEESKLRKNAKQPKRSRTAEVKYHKSCNYCRYRKVKCEVLEGLTVCEHCKLCDVECVFSRKEKSLKRRLKSAEIAATVQAASEQRQQPSKVNPSALVVDGSLPLWGTLEPSHPITIPSLASPTSSYTGTDPGIGTSAIDVDSLTPNGTFASPFYTVRERSDSIRSRDSNDVAVYSDSPMSLSEILGIENRGMRGGGHASTIGEIYLSYVRRFSPFLPTYIFDEQPKVQNESINSLARCCINLSSISAPDNMTPDATTQLLYEVLGPLLEKEAEWSPITIASVFLFAIRNKLKDKLILRIINRVNSFRASATPLDSGLVLGAVAVDSWNSLINCSYAPTIDPSLLQEFDLELRTLDDTTFAYHFLLLSRILYRLLVSTKEPYSQYSINGHRRRRFKLEILQIESDLLIWPVKLPKDLTVVKDELIAPSGAMLLHMLHNTVLLTLYYHAIKNPIYGNILSIVAIPGVLQFMGGMAKSTLKFGVQVAHKWPILRQCQVLTAQFMLDLYHVTEFQYCKVALSYWIDDTVSPELFRQIKQLLGDIDYSENSDGSVVFWLFRDIRSISLDMLLAEARELQRLKGD